MTAIKTLGEERVRTTFNPSSSDKVDLIKQKGAELINLVNSLKPHESWATIKVIEFQRIKEISLEKLETGIMYAVKAATS